MAKLNRISKPAWFAIGWALGALAIIVERAVL